MKKVYNIINYNTYKVTPRNKKEKPSIIFPIIFPFLPRFPPVVLSHASFIRNCLQTFHQGGQVALGLSPWKTREPRKKPSDTFV